MSRNSRCSALASMLECRARIVFQSCCRCTRVKIRATGMHVNRTLQPLRRLRSHQAQ